MKIRIDYVTNSSSSSYIICFARIANEEKAKKIIDKYDLDVFDADGVDEEKNWLGELGASWCGATIWGVDKVLAAHPDDKYIIIEDKNDADYNDWGEPIYDDSFYMDEAIAEIIEENGFADIDSAYGEGRDG